MNYCVVTTINKPTKAIEKLYEHFGNKLIIVGDKKTPNDWNYNGITPIGSSNKLYAPDNHYARKNLGYLEAIRRGATLIYESDDDNIPNETWKTRSVECISSGVNSGGWANVYRYFCAEFVWPRGFSLKSVISSQCIFENTDIVRRSSIQQGLSSGEADVDAIWRILINKPIVFTGNRSLILYPYSWCPFNSQSTWFFPKAYPLMYLPVYASFRMTDIWRSFVGQRCLWELGEGVTFHSPSEVFQDRNEHDLLKDFEDEIPGYLLNDRIVEILGELKLKQGQEFVCNNMLTCYQAIVDDGILPAKEIKSLKKWVKDYGIATGNL